MSTGAAANNVTRSAVLLVGPLLRYADESSATIWVETDRACTVAVRIGEDTFRATTWTVHDHHYALVRIDRLARCTANEYTVALDDVQVWPPEDLGFPPSVIRALDPGAPFRLAFGSCRRSDPLDDAHVSAIGADALVALANQMAEMPHASWPDALLLIGDQVYADEPSDAIVARLRRAHTDPSSDVVDEIQNFEEYTWLYHEAWTPPAVRWLLSTVSTAMLLDDHDLRDDWNTSVSWRREVTAQPWWHDRVVGAYGSYWVYQHLGNLSPDQLDADEVYAQILSIARNDDRTRYLDDVAWRADVDATSIRWSYFRDLGGAGRGVRLVAIDSRGARQLDPDDRRMVDAPEWAWVQDHVIGADRPFDHLVLASTLPWLMLPGVHHLEGWDEAISEGAWGRPGKWIGERLRQVLDLEHWAAFRNSFDETVEMITAVVEAPSPPATVLMLGGDVHCNYTAAAELSAAEHPATTIHQMTMSPFRNDIPWVGKVANQLLNRRTWTAVVHRMARWAKVPDVAMTWHVEHGPWFDNGVMTVQFKGRSADLRLEHADVVDGQHRLTRTLDVELQTERPSPRPDGAATATI
jgi:PhoD-like phosphatase